MAFWNDPTTLLPKQAHRWIISFGFYDDNTISKFTFNSILATKIPFYFAKSAERPSYDIGVQEAKYLYSHTFKFPKRVTWQPINVTFNDVKITESLEATKMGLKNASNYDNIFISPKIGPQGLAPIEDNTIVGDTTKLEFLKSTQLFFYKFLQEAGYFNPEELQQDDSLLRFRNYTFKKNMIGALVGDNSDYDLDASGIKKPSNTQLHNTIALIELDPSGFPLEVWKLYNPLITNVKFDKLDYSSENILSISANIHYDWAKLIPTTVDNQKKQTIEALDQRRQLSEEVGNGIKESIPKIAKPYDIQESNDELGVSGMGSRGTATSAPILDIGPLTSNSVRSDANTSFGQKTETVIDRLGAPSQGSTPAEQRRIDTNFNSRIEAAANRNTNPPEINPATGRPRRAIRTNNE